MSEVLAGRYELGETIGVGGMAVVYAARDVRLGRDVAVKVLRAEYATKPEFRERFLHEARAAAKLSHPNIVTVYDSGEDDGVPYLVSERLSGATLGDEMREPMGQERVRQVALDVLAALGAAHEAGIVHRDVKPGNILIADDGRAKVADFGIAKGAENLDLTMTGTMLGTAAYLSPERVAGLDATPRSDLFSLGIVLYEALAGQKPFAGDSPLALARAIQQDDPPPLAADVDPALAAAVMRALAKDPADRFADAGAMAAALSTATMPMTMPVEGAEPEATEQLATPTPARRSLAKRLGEHSALVALAIALLLIAAFAWVLASSHSPARRSPSPSPVRTAAPTPSPAPRASAAPAVPTCASLRELRQSLDAAQRLLDRNKSKGASRDSAKQVIEQQKRALDRQIAAACK